MQRAAADGLPGAEHSSGPLMALKIIWQPIRYRLCVKNDLINGVHMATQLAPGPPDIAGLGAPRGRTAMFSRCAQRTWWWRRSGQQPHQAGRGRCKTVI